MSGHRSWRELRAQLNAMRAEAGLPPGGQWGAREELFTDAIRRALEPFEDILYDDLVWLGADQAAMLAVSALRAAGLLQLDAVHGVADDEDHQGDDHHPDAGPEGDQPPGVGGEPQRRSSA